MTQDAPEDLLFSAPTWRTQLANWRKSQNLSQWEDSLFDTIDATLAALSRRVPASGGEVHEALQAVVDEVRNVGSASYIREPVLSKAMAALAAAPIVAAPEGGDYLLGRLLSQVHQVTAYHIERPPTPDYEPVQILNGELRELDDRFTAYALAAVSEGKAEPVAQPVKSKPSSARCEKPSGRCPNVEEVGGGFEGERYRCAVCGYSYFLDYEDMK